MRALGSPQPRSNTVYARTESFPAFRKRSRRHHSASIQLIPVAQDSTQVFRPVFPNCAICLDTDGLTGKGRPMNGDENGNKVDIDIGLSARASLEAKVSTEIPAQSTGQLVDALTDLFRPFTERRGLKADLIRLQREDVLIEIAKKVYRRLEIENAAPSPVPIKFLIPFLEKASLEDKDGFLIDRWADLLASSSLHPENAHPRFVQILSELTGDEAKLLREIAAMFHL